MRTELLAPAGSYEGLQAVVKAGADAVYIGGRMFGARAYAKNPEKYEMLEAIDYAQETQKVVNGIAKVKLYKGHAQVVARQSANSLYDENLATYTSADSFDQDAAIGFIKLWGLPTQVNSQVNHPFDN